MGGEGFLFILPSISVSVLSLSTGAIHQELVLFYDHVYSTCLLDTNGTSLNYT